MNGFPRTDFLTPTSGIGLGIASVLSIGGAFFLYNVSATPKIADANAIRSDWSMIGNDIRHAMKRANETDPSQRELPLGV